MDKHQKNQSKFLSLILRHKPSTIGITLDSNGWAVVSELVEKMPIELSLLHKIVWEDNKGRYSFNEDRSKIRANQGHSIDVDLGLAVMVPPELLYHGTATKSVTSIREKGLLSGPRQHVHLSADVETAFKVGSRHGVPVVLTVLSGDMDRARFKFYQSANGVWLTEAVPPKYIAAGEKHA